MACAEPMRSGAPTVPFSSEVRPALGIAVLPTTPHNTIDEILTESIQREESGVELYRELLALVKDKSVVLEEYATRLVSAEAVHLREMELMLMKRAPD